jgi:hypothetical protein
MTSKVYKSAQGRSVDLGTIMLQNEHVRAVGNMNVNARGDKLDSNNQVIDTKPRQIQRQTARTTNVSADPVQTSSTRARKARKRAPVDAQINTQGGAAQAPAAVAPAPAAPAPAAVAPAVVAPASPAPAPAQPRVEAAPVVEEAPVVVAAPPAQNVAPVPRVLEGGLAGAIARQREIKQELDKTRRQQAQAQGVRKI